MLIKITKSCSNGCIHCCNDSKPSDKHMTFDTFKDAICFAFKYDKYNIMGDELAGGEPTEHPQFFKFIDTYFSLAPINRILTIATNGHFLLENPNKIHEYLDKYPNLFFQVTYDMRYYPKKLDTTKRVLRHQRIYIVERLNHIFPQGRAVTNKIPVTDNINCPPCFNLKIIFMQKPTYSLSDFLTTVRSCNKFCIPSIQWDGSIAFGEYDCCPKLVDIYNSEQEILNMIYKFDCNGCPEAIEIYEKKLKDGSLKVKNF